MSDKNIRNRKYTTSSVRSEGDANDVATALKDHYNLCQALLQLEQQESEATDSHSLTSSSTTDRSGQAQRSMSPESDSGFCRRSLPTLDEGSDPNTAVLSKNPSTTQIVPQLLTPNVDNRGSTNSLRQMFFSPRIKRSRKMHTLPRYQKKPMNRTSSRRSFQYSYSRPRLSLRSRRKSTLSAVAQCCGELNCSCPNLHALHASNNGATPAELLQRNGKGNTKFTLDSRPPTPPSYDDSWNPDGQEEPMPKRRVPKNLNVKELRRHAKRFLTISHPYLECGQGLLDVFFYKHPVHTLLMAIVYIYCIINGWLIALVLAMLIMQLGINYLHTQKNISLGITFLPRSKIEPLRMDLTGVALVLELARYAQFLLEFGADILEKVQSLLLWRKPRVTAAFLGLCIVWFIAACFLSMSTYLTIFGLAVGIRLFITTYLFHRFPLLRHRLDMFMLFLDRLPTTKQHVNDLPTDSEERRLLREASVSEPSPNNLHPSASFNVLSQSTPNAQHLRTALAQMARTQLDLNNALYSNVEMEQLETRSAVSDLDRLSATGTSISEHDLGFDTEGWSSGMKIISRNCVHIDKEQPFPYTIGSGSLVLTDAALVFKYHRLIPNKRQSVQIPFDDIVSVSKTNSLRIANFMPSAHGIEVMTTYRQRPYTFAGILKREHFIELLCKLSHDAGHRIQFL